ncbi:MAG TPA: sialate O-acetylesterase [Opitutaceae bacterium]|nr:sialate O-acetylesterase [Opitutaceae bacterium]
MLGLEVVGRNRGPWWIGAVIVVAFAATWSRADVSLAPLFSDRAVLQREKPVPVWGRAAPGERVTVTFAGQTRATTTGADGRWIVYLDPLPASDQGADLVAAGPKNSAVIHDVVVGEVWLYAGSWNSELTVGRTIDAARDTAAARYPLLRYVRIDQRVADAPAPEVGTGGWQPALPADVGSFAAVAYDFGRAIHEKTGYPVGLVDCTWSETPLEAWLSPLALAGNHARDAIEGAWRAAVARYPELQAAYEKDLAAWKAAEAVAQKRGARAAALWARQHPPPVAPVPAVAGGPWSPSGLFDGMVNPLVPFAVRGALWSPGEGESGTAADYRARLTALVLSWRAHFGCPDAPFFWINLPKVRRPAAGDNSAAWIRDAQTQVLALPNTGQIITVDLGEPNDIDAAAEVAHRLALLAKCRVYDVVGDDSGPVFERAEREGIAMRVHFRNAGNGLLAHDRPPQALELAGADRVFYPATGRINGDTLLVSSPQVKDPVAVRYAWRDAPDGNLYNGAGLPAAPFRSDDW